MNTVLSVILLLASGVSSLYLKCPKSNGKFPVENSDCKSYYECENWKVINEKMCPDGQSFNPNLQWCDYDELYYCAEKEIEKYKRCQKPSGKFPKKNSQCRGYYECEKWKVTGEFTCPRGQNFNPDIQWCDWEELYPCLEDKPSEKCPKPNGYFPKPGSRCKIYYQCIGSKAYELHCPDDQVFDSVQGHCEWPELYSCEETREITTVQTSRATYPTTQPTSSTERKEITKTTVSSERTESTVRTSSTTNSIPTKVSESTKAESTVKTTPAADLSSKSTETERTDKYTLSSTEVSSRTKTEGTDKDYTTEETSTTLTSTMATGSSSFGRETSQTNTERVSVTPQTGTVTDTFSTASIRTDSPDRIVCPGAHGLFPHPTDETKFLSCVGFIPTVMDCPENLIFSQSMKTCTWRT